MAVSRGGKWFFSQARQCSTLVDREAMLYSKSISFRSGKGEAITVDAVYQDTHPHGGARAIVFAQHGSPGSHKDFKYMVPLLEERDIRVVSINYPGHGFTPNLPRLTWENEERNNFTRALLHSLELVGKKDIVFLGHSRGGENSLQLGVEYIEDCIGIVKLNCPGLRRHRGIRPYWPLEMAMQLVSIGILKPLMHPIIGWFYNKIGLRCSNGEVAATAMLTLRTFAFEKQKRLAEIVSKHPRVRLMYGYSGSDFLIEPENSHEMAACFDGRHHLECYTKGNHDDDKRVREEIRNYFASGGRILTAFFDKEDHFLQKHRASSIVEAIDAMVLHHEKQNRHNSQEPAQRSFQLS